MKYEILEHKADLKIRAFGKNKEELFLNMMLGMVQSLKPEFGKNKKETKRKIEIKSFDPAALLVDFLNEVLYLTQINKETYNNLKFIKFTERELTAEIFGQKAERFNEDIKAVTHYDLQIKQSPKDIWQATILFDI